MRRKKGAFRHLPWIGMAFILLVAFAFWRAYLLYQKPLPPPPTPPMAPLSPRDLPQSAAAAPGFTELKRFSFDSPDSLKNWEQKIFKGSTVFQVLREEGQGYLSCHSDSASSGLFVKVNQPATPDLYLSWKWRAKNFPIKENPETLSSRAEDDFAARIYVIFLASNLFRSDVIEYIWDQSLPAGTIAESPYSDRIKLFVLRSGPAGGEKGGWQEETVNPYQDYSRLFGKAPKNPIGMIALMSDSDNTRSHSAGDFADIVLKVKKPD